MKKYLKILQKCPLFENITEDNILKILGCLHARVETFDKKYTILSEGTPAKYIGILLSGSAHIIQFDYYGNKNILATVLPSDMFGEEFACASTASLPITVVANEPSEAMILDCNHILYTCESCCRYHQKMIFNLMRGIARKAITFQQRIEITSKRTTREKLMAYLLSEATRADSSVFDIPYDRQELADYLEVERSGLSTEIGKMQKEGIIRSRKNHFEIL